MLNGREPLRDCTNDTRRIDQLEMEKLKLSEGMDYLRQRIKTTEAENHRLLEEALQSRAFHDETRKQHESLTAELGSER